MNPDFSDFVIMSKRAGMRLDLTQAGGGNTSVKDNNGSMWIKSSGCLLSEVSLDSGYSIVNYLSLKEQISNIDWISLISKEDKEKKANQLLTESNSTTTQRPSIETFLHVFFRKFTLHVHPLQTLPFLISDNGIKTIKELFPDACIVDYGTPGIELALLLLDKIQNSKELPNVIFLKNHGLIINGDTYLETWGLLEKILLELETKLEYNFKKFRESETLNSMYHSLGEMTGIFYSSDDKEINSILESNFEFLNIDPTFPDSFVFNGAKALMANETLDKKEILKYKTEYHELPKVVYWHGKLHFFAKNLRKAKEMEEVMKLHLLSLKLAGKNDIITLPKSELAYLGNWESEKFRQNK